MKIGIITYHRSQNYGALLQAYALQTFIESLGHDVFLVDYQPAYGEDMYKLFSWNKFRCMSWANRISYLAKIAGTFVRVKCRQNNTRRYIEQNLHISDNTKFDLVIYGSDQIWRKQHHLGYPDEFNPVYFGEGFVETQNKISYAASMGKIDVKDENDFHFIESHLRKFNALSVREEDLQQFILSSFGLQCKLVLDPVLLLSKEQWKSHIEPKYLPSHKFIFYYNLQRLPQTDIITEEIVKQTGLPVVEFRGYIPFFHYGHRYRFTADAQEFLTLLSGAEYVVTSSFHGLALSLRFGKEFYMAMEQSRSSRAKTLLKHAGLEDRMIEKGNERQINTNNHINYEDVGKQLSFLETDSRDWLVRQIEIINGNI